jgi:rfaE bifunctional protein kinase chain/domain
MKRLRKLLQGFQNKRVVVFGDFVADVFAYGETSRISREAPVLVLNRRETQFVPGGGANAVSNLKALGATPIPVGVVGDDAEGHHLLRHLEQAGIDIGGIQVAESYLTPTKMRILAGAEHGQRQQVVRLDSGGGPLNARVRRGAEQKLKLALSQAQALVVSDYGYGLAAPRVSAVARTKHIPSIVDSRFALIDFKGMTAATPSESEVEAALNIRIGADGKKLEWAGRTLLTRLKCAALLITRGKDGMALFERGKKTQHIAIHGSDEVADVTGAGDTVIATFTLALASGASFLEAARLANYAGGIVVMKYGTRPVTHAELVAVVEEG